MPLLNYMLFCDVVGQLDDILLFQVGSSKIHIVRVKTCPLGLIVHIFGYDRVECRIVRFDVIFSVLDGYNLFYRLQLHEDALIVFVDLCQYISYSSIFFF